MRKVTIVLVVLSSMAVVSANAQCPGTARSTNGVFAYVVSNNPGTMGPLYLLNTPPCTTMVFGTMAPTDCNFVHTTTTARLTARFAATASNTSANGCIFNCGGGSCIVRGGDALPVELMEFTIDETEGEQSEPDR